jgi:hypothetical protein
MVKAYSILVWTGFFSSLALTAFACYLVFSKSTLIECYNGETEVPCSSIFSTGRKVGFVVSNVVGLLFQLCKSILPLCVDPSNRFFFSQMSVSSSGDTSTSLRTNRSTGMTLVSRTRRIRHTTPSKASRATEACWIANIDCNTDSCPAQTNDCTFPFLLLNCVSVCFSSRWCFSPGIYNYCH